MLVKNDQYNTYQSNEFVDVESLGQFESDAESNVFFMAKAIEAIDNAIESQRLAEQYFFMIDLRFPGQARQANERFDYIDKIIPTSEDLIEFREFFFNQSKNYGDLLNLATEQLYGINKSDADELLNELFPNGELNEQYLEELLKDEEKAKEILLLILSGAYDKREYIVSLFNFITQDKYQDIISKAMFGLEVVNADVKAVLNELLNELFEEEGADSVEGGLSASSKVAIFMSVIYAILHQSASLYERDKYRELDAEDYWLAVGDVTLSGFSAWLTSYLVSLGFGGVAAGIPAVTLMSLYHLFREMVYGDYELEGTGIQDNGSIYTDEDLDKMSDQVGKERILITDHDGNELYIEKSIALEVLREDWKSYLPYNENATNQDEELVNKFLNEIYVGMSDEEYKQKCDELKRNLSKNYYIDIYDGLYSYVHDIAC